jgi:hypothetical protein
MILLPVLLLTLRTRVVISGHLPKRSRTNSSYVRKGARRHHEDHHDFFVVIRGLDDRVAQNAVPLISSYGQNLINLHQNLEGIENRLAAFVFDIAFLNRNDDVGVLFVEATIDIAFAIRPNGIWTLLR